MNIRLRKEDGGKRKKHIRIANTRDTTTMYEIRKTEEEVKK